MGTAHTALSVKGALVWVKRWSHLQLKPRTKESSQLSELSSEALAEQLPTFTSMKKFPVLGIYLKLLAFHLLRLCCVIYSLWLCRGAWRYATYSVHVDWCHLWPASCGLTSGERVSAHGHSHGQPGAEIMCSVTALKDSLTYKRQITRYFACGLTALGPLEVFVQLPIWLIRPCCQGQETKVTRLSTVWMFCLQSAMNKTPDSSFNLLSVTYLYFPSVLGSPWNLCCVILQISFIWSTTTLALMS